MAAEEDGAGNIDWSQSTKALNTLGRSWAGCQKGPEETQKEGSAGAVESWGGQGRLAWNHRDRPGVVGERDGAGNVDGSQSTKALNNLGRSWAGSQKGPEETQKGQLGQWRVGGRGGWPGTIAIGLVWWGKDSFHACYQATS